MANRASFFADVCLNMALLVAAHMIEQVVGQLFSSSTIQILPLESFQMRNVEGRPLTCT